MAEVIFFYIFGGITVAGALGVISFRNPVASALSLVGAFIGLASLYVLLNAEFVAVMQILVYAGAVMVLFLFVIMLLNLNPVRLKGLGMKFRSLLGILVGGYLVVLLVLRLGSVVGGEAMPVAEDFGSAASVGRILFSRYLVPLEAIGVLLLIAVVGAIVLAQKEDS